MKNTRDRRGYTLIEVLIVITIIALLAAIIYAAFSAARKQSNGVSCSSNLHQIYLALKMYQSDYGDMPNSSQGLQILRQTYIKDTRIFHCPFTPPYPGLPPNALSYKYYYKIKLPAPEADDPVTLGTWEAAYEFRGEALPLAICPFHASNARGEAASEDADLGTSANVLRMDGSVSLSHRAAPSGGKVLSWYDF